MTTKGIAFGDLEREIEVTRKVLQRLPDDKLKWRPHDRSWTMGGLGTHVSNLPTWMTSIITTDVFDFAKAPPPLKELESTAEIVNNFDRNIEVLIGAFSQVDDDELARPWTLKHGDQVLSSDPKNSVFRLWGISHLVHHRAQLAVYLRLVDEPVPAIYGPSADER